MARTSCELAVGGGVIHECRQRRRSRSADRPLAGWALRGVTYDPDFAGREGDVERGPERTTTRVDEGRKEIAPRATGGTAASIHHDTLKLMFKRNLVLPAPATESFFLWGPRQTGKSTLLRATYRDALWVDLLKADAYRRQCSTRSTG
jgi:hypothetical protein